MGWLQQHTESSQVGVVALVLGQLSRFRGRLSDAEARRSHGPGGRELQPAQPEWVAGRWAHHPRNGWYWIKGFWR